MECIFRTHLGTMLIRSCQSQSQLVSNPYGRVYEEYTDPKELFQSRVPTIMTNNYPSKILNFVADGVVIRSCILAAALVDRAHVVVTRAQASAMKQENISTSK